MPQSKSIPPGKAGKPYGKRSKSLVYNMVRLNRTYYSLFKLQAKFSKFSSPVKFQQITQILRSSPPQSTNSAKFAHFTLCFAHFTLCFRHLPRQRTLQNSGKLCKFRAIRPHSPRIPRNPHILLNLFYIMFQAPAPTENAQEFQRIMQIPRNSPTQSANYAKFAPFANTTPYVSDA